MEAWFMLLQVGLAIGMLLFVTLRLLASLLLNLLRVHVVPRVGAVVVGLPARSGILVNVSVMPGVQVAARSLAHGSTTVSTGGPKRLAALRPLRGCHRSLCGRVVLRVRGFISL